MVIRLEKEYGIQISDQDASSMKTVGQTIRYLWTRGDLKSSSSANAKPEVEPRFSIKRRLKTRLYNAFCSKVPLKHMTDLQGSVRAVMNNNGVGTSTVIARHDYLPFGEEISSGVGMRTGSQGYNVPDSNRQKYAMLERDSTGLDHTWWRKI